MVARLVNHYKWIHKFTWKIFFSFFKKQDCPGYVCIQTFVKKKTCYIQVKRMKIREKDKNIAEIPAR